MRYYQLEDLKDERYNKLYIDTLIEFIHESLNVKDFFEMLNKHQYIIEKAENISGLKSHDILSSKIYLEHKEKQIKYLLALQLFFKILDLEIYDQEIQNKSFLHLMRELQFNLNQEELICSFEIFELENQEENPELKAYREFQVTKFETLYLHGVDRGKQPDHLEKSGRLSANPEIVQVLFNDVLSPYGIQLNKVVMHDYKDFESIDYSFINPDIYNKLCDLIDYTFRKNLT